MKVRAWEYKDSQRCWWKIEATLNEREENKCQWWCSIKKQSLEEWNEVWGDFVETQDDNIELGDVAKSFLSEMASLGIEMCLFAEEKKK